MAGLENSEYIWKIQRKPEVVVSVSLTEIIKHMFDPKGKHEHVLKYLR
jgi:hypothetical protein